MADEQAERPVKKPPKQLKIPDPIQFAEIKREYAEDYHAYDEKMRRLDINDFG